MVTESTAVPNTEDGAEPAARPNTAGETSWVHEAWRPPSRTGRGRLRLRLRWSRLRRELTEDERGAVTAEYAIVIMAAVAFAGLLVAIMRSSEIRAMLVELVENALGAAG